tara:strand:- start:4834 stop:5385 length:552 start_codon:yes stop_codon:yes gene_type:complete
MRIIVQDNFLPNYSELKRYSRKVEIKEQLYGNKIFNVGVIPSYLQIPFYDKIQNDFFSKKIKPTICYFRLSTPDLDNDIRIHTDQNHCDYIGIIFLTESNNDIDGTAFWEHPIHGNYLYDKAKPKEIDNIIEYEGKDETMWRLDNVISARENRLIMYKSNMFHSRYPFKPTYDRMAAVFFWSI